MFCKYCGVELPDDSAFCSKCGKKIEKDIPVNGVVVPESPMPEEQMNIDNDKNEVNAIEPVIEESASTDESVTPVRSKSKKIMVIGIAATLIVVLALGLIFLFGNRMNVTSPKAEASVVYADLTDDGTAYIPMLDGTCIVINDEVDEAVITKDREHIVVFLEDGTLYVTDKEQSKKTEIADNCGAIRYIRNDGFFYNDTAGNVYRILFSDFSSQKLGHQVAITIAVNNTTAIYATDGNIYTMRNTETESNKIGHYSGSIVLDAISDNGEISVWDTEKNGITTIVLNDGDDKVTLGEVDNDYNFTTVTFTKDQGLAVIENSYSDCLWIKTPGKEPIKAKLGADPMNYSVCTSKGNISTMKTKDVTSLYVATEADTGSNVYNVSLEGDRERILSKVTNYYIADNNIVYTDMDRTLYIAKLDGKSVSNETKIASEVDTFELTDNGQYVYYMKDCDGETGSLYCYKIRESDSVKVAADVAYYNGWNGWMYTTYSIDGSSVFFFKDLEELPGTYTKLGTLMLWSYDEDSATKISSDVMNYSVTSLLTTGEVNTKSFLFMKYNSADDDDNVYVNRIYHNGKDATKLASDVIY